MKIRACTWVAAAVLAAGTAVAVAAVDTTTPATSTPGAAGGQHRGARLRGAPMLRAIRQLNPTTAQQQSIRDILKQARTQAVARRQANHQGGATTLAALANPGDPNYANAVEDAKTQAAARIQAMSDVQLQIYDVLTAQQKAQLPQVLADMQAQRQQRRAAWQAQHQGAAATH